MVRPSFEPTAAAAHVAPEIEERFANILEGPWSDHESHVEKLCREHPEHTATFWCWLALARGVRSQDDGEPLPSLLRSSATHIGGYMMRRKIGQGGMGIVYEAEHEGLGRRVALKMIRSDLLDSSTARERFRREVLAASRLDHPGICRVHEVGEDRGVPQTLDAVPVAERQFEAAAHDGVGDDHWANSGRWRRSRSKTSG